MINEKENEILEELKQIKKLLALSLVKSESSETEQVKMLKHYGFQPIEISELLQKNPSTVRNILFQARQAKEKKK